VCVKLILYNANAGVINRVHSLGWIPGEHEDGGHVARLERIKKLSRYWSK